MRVVGIDPGTGRIGYALLEWNRRTPRLIAAETITIPPRRGAAERLTALERALTERLARDRPEVLALEKLFFAKNTKTALAVAEARGIILLTAHRCVRNIREYTPLAVKLAVTGYGRADKASVRRMLRLTFPGSSLPVGDDAVDAIAVALTAIFCATPTAQPQPARRGHPFNTHTP